MLAYQIFSKGGYFLSLESLTFSKVTGDPGTMLLTVQNWKEATATLDNWSACL